MGKYDSFLDTPSSAGKYDAFLDEGSQPEGGFVAAAKQAIGAGIKGAGQVASDYIPGVTSANPVSAYGQSVIDANPTSVTNLGGILESPWQATKEAVGNAAGSMGSMLGTRALGTGITAAAPFTGPAAPFVAGAGQLIANVGPFVAAALPSYGGIREEQIRANPLNDADAKSKAIAALGAGTVGAIEGSFGPQAWALAAMKKGGIEEVAKKFADAKSITGAIGKGFVKGAAVEGAEEVVQNPIEQVASYRDPTTKEAISETLFGGAMGALGGGVAGGGISGAAYAISGPLSKAVAAAPGAAVPPVVPVPTAGIDAQSAGERPANFDQENAAEALRSKEFSSVTTSPIRGENAPLGPVPSAGIASAAQPQQTPTDMPVPQAIQNAPAAPGSPSPVSAADPLLPAKQAEAAGAPIQTPQGPLPSANQTEVAIPPAQGPEAAALPVAAKPAKGIAAALQYPQQVTEGGGPLAQQAADMPLGRFVKRGENGENGENGNPAGKMGIPRESPGKLSGNPAFPADISPDISTDIPAKKATRIASSSGIAGALVTPQQPTFGGAPLEQSPVAMPIGELGKRAPVASRQTPPDAPQQPLGGAGEQQPAPKYKKATARSASHYRVRLKTPLGNFDVFVEKNKDSSIDDYKRDAKNAFVADSNMANLSGIAQISFDGNPEPVSDVSELATVAKNARWARIAKVEKAASQPQPKPLQQLQPAPIMRRDDLVGAIMRVTGGDGIASNMALTIAKENAGKNLPRLRGLFTNRGWEDLGEIATLLRNEEGFSVRDGEHLSQLIEQAASGTAQTGMARTERDLDAERDARHRDYIRQNAKKLKIKSVAVKFTDLEQRVIAALTRRHERAVELLDERAKKRFDAALEESYALLPEDVVDAVLVDVNGRGLKTLEFWKEATKLLRYMVADAMAQKEQEAFDAIEGAEPDWLKDDDGRGNQPAGGRGEADRVAEEARGESGFNLAAQTPEEIASAEAAAKEAKQAEEAAAAAEARKEKAAQDKAEKARRAAEVLKEREAAKKAEVDKAAEEFALGQAAPEPVVKKVTTEEAKGQKDIFSAPASKIAKKNDEKPKTINDADIAIANGKVTGDILGYMKDERDAARLDELRAEWRQSFAGNHAETIAAADITRSDYEKLGDLIDRGGITSVRAAEMIDSAVETGILDAKVAEYMKKKAIPTKPAAKEAIGDIGEKIGGARKDMASSGASVGSRKNDDSRPAWARRFEIGQIVTPGGMIGQVPDSGRWVIRDGKNLDWRGAPKQVGSTFATKEEAEAFIPIAAVSLKHRVVSVARKAQPEIDVDAMLKADMDAKAEDDAKPGKIEYGLMESAKARLANGRITQADFDRLKDKYGEAAAQYTPPPERVQKLGGGDTYEIWRDISDRKRVKIVDKQFDSRDEAMRYMLENAVQIIKTNTTFGEADIPLPPNKQRSGPARRTGNVSGEDFKNTFGLRGVEFGNWNNQDDRQSLMNDAWDGLMDLADVLGIPAKALGLNGDLALAFGARGQGLNSARAHYEGQRVVINLTKEKGAGSLAHEWFHAMDHYFGRQDGKAAAEWQPQADGTRILKGEQGGEKFISSWFGYKSKVRPELREAYDALMKTIFKKAETYVEDTAKADKFTGTTREELARQLDALRKELSEQKDPKYWKRNNKPASAELLAEFDTIAKAMIDGDVMAITTDWRMIKPAANKARAMPASRWTNDSLERLSAIYKEVRGRSGFDGTNKQGVMDRLVSYMNRYSQRLKMLADAQAGAEKQRMVPTSFAMNAKELDQGRGGDYWTTPHEMAARAFQGYVEDKVAERGGTSRFLNYAPENAGILTPWGAKLPFPAGQERKAINAALDKFVWALQTKEGEDGGLILFSQESPSFYSQLSSAIASARVTSQPAAQWKAWINGNAGNLGIKKDEIEWSGILDYLDVRGKGKVTKAEIADYLSGNGVRVEDVVKQGVYETFGTGRNVPEETSTKFANYWDSSYKGGIPGTYREILVTLPASRKGMKVAQHPNRPEGYAIQNQDGSYLSSKSGTVVYFHIREAAEDMIGSQPDKAFRSSHWDEPNVLVHIRTDEVIGADGKRYLRVGEIQSDWGQKGKKEGFKGRSAAEIEADLIKIPDGDPAARPLLDELKSARDGVPQAPFVTDTRAWAALGIKRAIIHAINSGVDGVVFGTGEQNANLYDLSKQVSRVAAKKSGESAYDVRVYGMDGMIVDRKKSIQADELEDYIGKDIAKRIIDDVENTGLADYQGLDLKVGGEGMRAFYDQIIPSAANDVLKKVGGGKIAAIRIDGTDYGKTGRTEEKAKYAAFVTQPGFTITPQMRAKIQSQGVPLFSFAGQQSATADQFRLDRAKQLLADGANANSVRQQTGWFKGVDGKWRYEIDDSGASLKAHGFGFGELLDALGKNLTLADVLDHPALFAAYPSIAGSSVEAIDEKSQNNGELVTNKDGGFTIRVNAGLGEAKALSVMLHEIQHGIQNVEGFASGGNIDRMAGYDEPRIKAIENRISSLLGSGKQGKEIAPEIKRLNARIAEIRKEDPYQAYRKLAGEVESRNVQRRQNFPADKRRLSDPLGTQDVAPEDVIVVFNGMDAKDAPAPANTTRASAMAAVGASPADAAVFDMASEGRSAQEILSFLSKASRRPFNRVLAAALSRIGVSSTVSIDPAAGWRNNQGRNGAKFAASYSPKTDTVALYTPREAERHILHEFLHAASLKAIARGGPAARQMQAIFDYVQRTGTMSDQYGMGNFSRFQNETDAQFKKRALDEFTAELFTNPQFQVRLKQLPAPSGSKLKSAWDWIVRVIANLLGLKTRAQETALDRALSVGAALLQENAALTMPAGQNRYSAGAGGRLSRLIDATAAAKSRLDAFDKGITSSKVADDGKYFDRIDAVMAAENALAEEIAKIPDDALAVRATTSDGRMVTLTKSAQQEGKYQITRFDAKSEPWGDTLYPTKLQAAKEFVSEVDVKAIEVSDGTRFSQEQPFSGREVAATPMKPGATTLMVDGVERPAMNSNGKPLDFIAPSESPVSKRSVDGLRSDAKLLSDIFQQKSFIAHGYSGLDIPTQRAMLHRVLSLADDLQIVNSVIKLIPVDVMNILRRKKLSADALFNDESVLKKVLSADSNGSVTTAIDVANALVRAIAGVATEISGANKIGSFSEYNPASRASNLAGFSVGQDDLQSVYNDLIIPQSNSYSGNTGAFSPEDPDIRYSLATNWQQSPVAKEVAKAFDLAIRSDKKLSWLNPVQTQYHKAERLAADGRPMFKRVFDLGQKFLNDISRFAVMAENAAPTLFHQIKSVADVRQAAGEAIRGDFGKQRNADIRAIAAPLYEGTLYGGGNPMSGVVWNESQLRQKFGLTDRQITLYQEAREAVKVSMDEMAKSLITRHAKREKVMVDSSLSLSDVADEVSNALNLRATVFKDDAEAAHDEAMQQVKDLRDAGQDNRADADEKLADAKLESAMKEIERIGETVKDIKAIADKANKLQEAGYFPLMRFGKHTVTAKDADGKVQHFSMHDGIPLVPRSGQIEANKLADALREENPDWTVTTGLMNPEKYKLYQGMNVDALQLFADHLDDETKQAYQEIIRLATNERSALKRMLKREGTPGFDKDVRRTLASFILSNARYTSSSYHLSDMTKAAELAEKDGGDIGGEAVKLVDYITKPQEEAAKIRGFLFFNFLGGSLAAAMVNATQIPMMTFPRLSQYEPATKLAARLARVAKMAVLDPAKVPGDIGYALRRAEEDGITAPHQIYELTGTASNNIFAGSRGANAIMRAWGAPFALAESFNRRATFLASYEIAKAMNPAQLQAAGATDAYEFAAKMIAETQGIYNRGNRVNVGRGALGATVMTFKQFSIMYLEMLSRMPAKQQAIMVGMLLLAAGAGGLPFAEDAEDIIDTIGQWMGYRTNTKRTIRNALTGAIGQTAADITMNGLLSRIGVDLHSRLGLHNILPGSALLKPSTTDKSREFQDLLGPAASVVASLGQAMQSIAEGKPDRAAMALAPVAIQNAVKGAKMAATGRAEDMGGKPTITVSASEAAAKGIGFNPKAVADYGAAKRDILQDERLLDVWRERFTADIVQAVVAQDAEALQKARQAVADWNARHPDGKIAINPASIRRRVAEMRSEGPQRVLKSLTPALRQQARQELYGAQ